jgi:hypothetical protein
VILSETQLQSLKLWQPRTSHQRRRTKVIVCNPQARHLLQVILVKKILSTNTQRQSRLNAGLTPKELALDDPTDEDSSKIPSIPKATVAPLQFPTLFWPMKNTQ